LLKFHPLGEYMFTPFNQHCISDGIEPLQTLITAQRKKIDELLKISSKTYQNFVRPLELLDEEMEIFFTPISHINSVANSKESQALYAEALPLLTEFSTEVSQNLTIYEAYKQIMQNEHPQLNAEQKQVLKQSIQGFELSGANLDDTKKARIAEINIERSALSNEFSQNILDATNAFELIIPNAEDVEGLPQNDLALAKCDEGYRFTLQMPSYLAYLTYGPNQTYREALYKAYTTRAPQNSALIDTILALRDEKAKLLGFNNYAELSLQSKMAPKPEKVIAFLEELAIKTQPQAKREIEELKAFAKSESLQSFDVAYYSEKLKAERYSYDEEEFRPYFEKNSVVEGLFSVLHQLFGISFTATDEIYYEPSVTSYNISKNGKIRARIILDLESRANKRGGAWMANWQSHHQDVENIEQLASAFVVCNFPATTSSTPSLLRHDDVVTLFHEMGHAIHHLLSSVNENSVSGVNGVEWDAVEYPSQFLENFAFDTKVLQTFATHIETKEVLPAAMIEKLQNSRNFQSALSMLRQLEFGLFDMKLHTSLYQGKAVQALLDSVREKTALLQPPAYNRFQNGFSHIFAGGYAAGYYSYKWAEVLSADTYMQVIDEGLYTSETAQNYAKIILDRGGSESMMELYTQLMQREPNSENLLRLNGIA